MAKYNTVGDTGCSEKQLRFIELKLSTDMTISDICKEIGITRQLYYDSWIKDEAFQNEINRQLLKARTEGLQYLSKKFADAARKYWEIIEGKGNKTQAMMLIDYFDRFAGKAITPVAVKDETTFDLHKYLMEIKEEGEETESDS